jgi:NarL family two-component system response regulator LiaR
MVSSIVRTRPLQIAVANDYELVVAGVARLLERYDPRLRVVDLLVHPEQPDSPVDVVLFDTYGRTTVEASARVAELARSPRIGHVAVFTLSWTPELVRWSLDAGADGVLSKSLRGGDLAAALERIAQGQSVVDPGPGTPSRAEERPWPGRSLRLTERESEVLALAGSGLTNEEIAGTLHLGVNTIKTHLRSAYRKAGLRNRSAAVAFTLRNAEFRHPD